MRYVTIVILVVSQFTIVPMVISLARGGSHELGQQEVAAFYDNLEHTTTVRETLTD